MLSAMRLVLALCVLFTVYIDPTQLTLQSRLNWWILGSFVVYSLVPLALALIGKPYAEARLNYWVDVFWIALIVYLTHGTSSIFVPIFFFAIASASFRWGFDEGARVTLACTVLFLADGLLAGKQPDVARLLLRTVFILTFGYMAAHWGESKVRSARRLALLRDVARLPNPRFGVDYAMVSMLEKTLAFYHGKRCILVTRENGSDEYALRVVEAGNQTRPVDTEYVDAAAVSPLMDLPFQQIVVHNGHSRLAPFRASASFMCEGTSDNWEKADHRFCEQLAGMLEAESFISAALASNKAEYRIYVVSDECIYKKADALFLAQAMTQALPAIENLALVDRMASEAAYRERQKIGWDLHDTAIQPYIGLKLGLDAMRRKAEPGNPLAPDLEKLVAMTSEVIRDLRHYAGSFSSAKCHSEEPLLAQLKRKAELMKEFHGIDIDLDVGSNIRASDRLVAEISQIVSEGLSNISKHTDADKGRVNIRRINEVLHIEIENECIRPPSAGFIPRSITERTAILGGKTYVKQGPGGRTAVHVEIPI